MIMRQPFTSDEVRALNRWQKNPIYHPFTCSNRGDGNHGDGEGVLEAMENGWKCPHCSYTQDWAHDFMTKAHTE